MKRQQNLMKRITCIFLFLWGVMLSFALADQTKLAAEKITLEEVKKQMEYLASDALKGRDSGSKGCEEAAAFIRQKYTEYGLKPLGDQKEGEVGRSYYQRVEVGAIPKLAEKGNQLILIKKGQKIDYKAEENFLPLALTANALVEKKEVAFVGYGITDKTKQYDDYQGIDVTGKVVVMFRYEQGEATEENHRHTPNAYFTTKIQNAIDHGVAGIIIVNGPHSQRAGEEDPFAPLQGMGRSGNKDVPVIHVKRPFFQKLLEETDKTMEGLQKSLDEQVAPQSFLLKGVTITMGTNLFQPSLLSDNVIGYIEGSDPKLKDEFIVVGAHYDHIGLGYYGGRWGQRGMGKIHNGADDNATGTVAILQAAKVLAQRKERPKRSVVFICFTGEERGIIGSNHFVNEPTFPIEKIVAMINADMIGRYADKNFRLAGVATSSVFEEIVDQSNEGLNLEYQKGKSGFAPGDSMPFLSQGIPILNYFTGIHDRYHTPEDTLEYIDMEGLTLVARHLFRTAAGLADLDKEIDFIEVQTPRRVTLGIYPEVQGDKVVVNRVMNNTPAQRAGLQEGDILVKLGEKEIQGIEGLTTALSAIKRGEEVGLLITRPGSGGEPEKKSLKVQF